MVIYIYMFLMNFLAINSCICICCYLPNVCFDFIILIMPFYVN